MGMVKCSICHQNPASKVLGICTQCLRQHKEIETLKAHSMVRNQYALPTRPVKNRNGIVCTNCSNHCRLSEKQTGYCGIRKNIGGKIKSIAPDGCALAYYYLDPLPTNCCAAWFCKGSQEKGYNLAVFFYGCNFNCLFCQNSSHKRISSAPIITQEELLNAALKPEVRCVCFFGGSPEPQMEFALTFSKNLLKKSTEKHICWEWNGCGNPQSVKKAAEISSLSGGTVKFDLKAFHPNISTALCGVNTSRSFDNFKMLAEKPVEQNMLTATTLLVSYYIDATEIENIARFIANLNPDIPYSLLVFHPDFYLKDLPITPKDQAKACYDKAANYLKKVHIGNKYLL
jgi:pyruvate formate lyase activating enzyme